MLQGLVGGPLGAPVVMPFSLPGTAGVICGFVILAAGRQRAARARCSAAGAAQAEALERPAEGPGGPGARAGGDQPDAGPRLQAAAEGSSQVRGLGCAVQLLKRLFSGNSARGRLPGLLAGRTKASLCSMLCVGLWQACVHACSCARSSCSCMCS